MGVATASAVSRNFLTIKYKSDGQLMWASKYDHNGLVDVGAKVELASGEVAAWGTVQVSATTWKLGKATYNATTGAQTSAGATSSSIALDEVNGFADDGAGNLYVAGARNNGSTGYDALLIKVGSNFEVAWEAVWDGDNAIGDKRDVAKAVAVDASGNAYVTGYTSTPGNGRDYLTIKYNSSGTEQWAKTYDGAAHGEDIATDIATDANGNSFVTGHSLINCLVTSEGMPRFC